MNKIAPSLLAADFLNLDQEIKNINNSGAEFLHLDVMDGHFVPNLSYGFPIISKIREKTDLKLDVHLMVTNPEDYLESCIKSKIDYVSFHVESAKHIHRLIKSYQENGIKTGVALNPGTSINLIEPIIKDLDFVLLMSVNPGFGGQSFLPLVHEKIKTLNKWKSEKKINFEIQVDGGINDTVAKDLNELGVDILVAGSYVFKSDDYKRRVRSLR